MEEIESMFGTSMTRRWRLLFWLMTFTVLGIVGAFQLAEMNQTISAPPVSKSIRPPDAGSTVPQQNRRDLATATIPQLQPLHEVLGPPRAGDWLVSHKEDGQTFEQYLAIKPVTPTGERRIIYVQPLGEFTKDQRAIVDLSAEYLALYFNRPVRVLRDLPPSAVPSDARRTHPQWGMKQILSTYVLDRVLKPRLPDDAAAYIAFTATDLWPGDGWNFVFGQASLRERVGVWSINRNGDPTESDEAFAVCLRRTLKTATHETGHMFSIKHCTAYECNMCGSNNREESDRHPLYLCPQCHAKICWATGADPVRRYEGLAEFCKKHQLHPEREYFERAAAILSE